MNLRDLRYIIAVADLGHFGRAAEACYVGQPTLSGQVRKLEEELGVTLFERTNRRVQITPVGAEVVAMARRVVDQADAISHYAEAHRDPLAGSLRLGAIPTLSPYLMPLILRPLRREVPQMRLVLSEEMTDTLLERLARYEIDAALLATPVEHDDYAALPLYDEPFWLAYPPEHPFYLKESITHDELAGADMLLLAEGHCLSQQVLDLCQRGERSQVAEMADLRAASLETLLGLVAAGFGATLVPALALAGTWTSGSGIITRELDFDGAWRRISLVYRESFPRRAALDALAAVIVANLPNTVRIIWQPAP